MPEGIIFDTHHYVKQLRSVGFTEEQAEVLASTQANLINERLATKVHPANVEAVLRRDIKELELGLSADFKREMAELKTDIIKWVAGMLVAQAAVVATLVKLL